MRSVTQAASELSIQVAELLARSAGPVGSHAISLQLARQGIDTSPATAGRVLAGFDQLGFTRRVSNLGRVLTEEGHAWLQGVRRRRIAGAWGARVLRDVGRATLMELRHAMVARRRLEGEAARLAAESASPDQLGRLRRILQAHRESLARGGDGAGEAKDFHVALAEVSGNPYIASALHLIRTSTRNVEDLMFQLGATIGGDCFQVHGELLMAIEGRDPRRACDLAENHLSGYIGHIDRWLAALGPEADPGEAALGFVGAGPELSATGTAGDPGCASGSDDLVD
jgi:hypothetical protein